MKEIFLKMLENQRLKYEKLYCKHEWVVLSEITNKIEDIITKATSEKVKTFLTCKKCGKIKTLSFED